MSILTLILASLVARSFDEMDKWAKDARTNNIQFEGLEHKGSSLRAENHEYMSTDDIRPSPNPQQELQMMLGGVGTQEWPELFHTLNSVRRLSLHHGQLLESHVHSVLRSVLKAVDNLRSTIAKNAMLTIADMWMGMGRVMDPELNLVAPMLVKRFADTNGFLSEVAEECIGTVITNASDGRCLGAFLLSASNKQPLVRAKAAAVILRCVNKFSPEKLASSRELGKLIQSLALFCQDRQVKRVKRRRLCEDGANNCDYSNPTYTLASLAAPRFFRRSPTQGRTGGKLRPA